MKKLITIILIVIILLGTVLSNNRVWASNTGGSVGAINDISSVDDLSKKNQPQSESSESAVGSFLAFFVRLFPTVVGSILNLAISSESNNTTGQFTIEDVVLNKIALFDVNIVNTPKADNMAMYQKLDTNTIIKNNVLGWYGAIRNLAAAILLVVLIIIGILMAINSVASERAKYKEMLVNWFVSLAILILMPYIMSLSFNICNAATDTVSKLADSWGKNSNIERTLVYGNGDDTNKSTGNKDFEYFEGIASKISRSTGWQAFSFSLIWALLAYFQIKFFFMYLKRLFIIAFLVLISPLITITYSIDKANDNQAQAFKKWISEFLVNLFIQPLHAILYIVFIYSTYEIMQRAPILAILFLWSLSRGETILRRIFRMDKSMSLGRLGRRKK